MKKYDFNGDNRSDIPVSSPWGLGTLSLQNNRFASNAIAQNGTRLGGWMLNTANDTFRLRGDFDGDGQCEMLVSSGWGIGILKQTGNAYTSVAMVPNGSRIGGWLLNTADNRFCFAADIDGDGKSEIVVVSPWGLGAFKLEGDHLVELFQFQNGTRFGGWLLNTADNEIRLAADFDGDGSSEFVITSPWGIGILKWVNNQLVPSYMAPNGTRIGEYEINTATQRFCHAADLSGEGHSELVVTGQDFIAAIKLNNNQLQLVTLNHPSNQSGDWIFQSTSNGLGVVGDFDGDGKQEIIISNWDGLAILKLVDGKFKVISTAKNGERLGEWLLNTRDNRINIAASFTGGIKDECLFTSPWGIGVMRLEAGHLTSVAMQTNGGMCNAWRLNTHDNDLEIGNYQSRAVIAYHDQWPSAPTSTREKFHNRGYYVDVTGDATVALQLLNRLSNISHPGDRIFCYLAGHGSDPRGANFLDEAVTTSQSHFVQFNSGEIWVSQLSPVLKKIASAGADLTVFDGSCNGGETVLNAFGERYCASATTSVYAPALTDTPAIGNYLENTVRQSSLGDSWDTSRSFSGLMNGYLVRTLGARIQQRIFTNTDNAVSRLSIFFRPNLTLYGVIDNGVGWNLMCTKNYLFERIYPEIFVTLPAADKPMYTNSVAEYIKFTDSYDAPRLAFAGRLKAFLNDEALVSRAASKYAQSFDIAWQRLAQDSNWNVTSDPLKHMAELQSIIPTWFSDVLGFKSVCSWILATIASLETQLKRHRELLLLIDQKINKTSIRIVDKVIDLKKLEFKNIRVQDPEVFQIFDKHLSKWSLALSTPQIQELLVSSRMHQTLDSPLMLEKWDGIVLQHMKSQAIRRHIPREVAANVTSEIAEFREVSLSIVNQTVRLSIMLSLFEDACAMSESSPAQSPGQTNFI
jgi:hypothetical protein